MKMASKVSGRTEFIHILFKEWHNYNGKPYIDWYWNNMGYNRDDKYKLIKGNETDLP